MKPPKTHLEKLYKEDKMTLRSIGKLYNVSGASVSHWFKDYGIPVKSFKESKVKSINKDFFNYNTPEFAFALGYIFANSYLSENKANKKKKFLKIHSSNVFWIDKIRSLIKAEYKIGHRKSKLYNGKLCNEIFWLHLENQKIIGELIKLGLTKDKYTNFRFPKIDKVLYGPFIRGYWGGNGLITLRNNNPYIHLNSKSLQIIHTIEKFFHYLDMKSAQVEIVKRKKSTTYRLSYSDLTDIKIFYFQLFRNVPKKINFYEQENKLKDILNL